MIYFSNELKPDSPNCALFCQIFVDLGLPKLFKIPVQNSKNVSKIFLTKFYLAESMRIVWLLIFSKFCRFSSFVIKSL
jgi:hypothetical protein